MIYLEEKNTGTEDIVIELGPRDFQYNGRWVSAREIFFAHLDFLEGKGTSVEDGKHTIDMELPMDGDELFYRMGSSLKRVQLSASYKMDILNR